jgi:hypothetical protein
VVDVLDVGVREDGVRRHVTEQGDFLFRLRVQPVLGAPDQNVGLEPDRAQLLHRVLGRLRLLLAVLRVGDERDVGKEDILVVLLVGELAEGFEEGHRLDVADRPTDLDQTDVGALGGLPDAPLDVVGDVRDDLDGLAEVVAGALALDDVLVGLPRGDVVVERHVGAEEALVVAQVEVDLAAVLEDVHLAVFVRVHRSGVDVEIGVHLDGGDVEARVREKTPGAGGGDALTQSGHHPACDEHELPTQRRVVPCVGIRWHIDRPSGVGKTVSDPPFRVDVRDVSTATRSVPERRRRWPAPSAGSCTLLSPARCCCGRVPSRVRSPPSARSDPQSASNWRSSRSPGSRWVDRL